MVTSSKNAIYRSFACHTQATYDGGMLMDVPPHEVMIAGWISGEDLNGSEAVGVRDWRDSLLGLPRRRRTRSDPCKMFAMSRVLALLLSLGLAKLVRRNFPKPFYRWGIRQSPFGAASQRPFGLNDGIV